MKLQGISQEGMKRLASKVKGKQARKKTSALFYNENPDFGHEGPFEGTIEDALAEMQEMFEVWADEEIDRHDDVYGPAPSKEEIIERMKEEFIKGLREEPMTASKRAQEKGTGGNEYWNTVKAIAQDIKEEYQESGGDFDVEERIWEEVDGSEYIIYYHKNLEVLQNSDNSDEIDNVGAEIDTSKGWQAILTQVAFYAMEADVRDALSEIGYGTAAWQGGFEDDEEDY